MTASIRDKNRFQKMCWVTAGVAAVALIGIVGGLLRVDASRAAAAAEPAMGAKVALMEMGLPVQDLVVIDEERGGGRFSGQQARLEFTLLEHPGKFRMIVLMKRPFLAMSWEVADIHQESVLEP